MGALPIERFKAAGLFFAIGILLLGIKCSVSAAHFFVSFLDVQSLLNTLQDLRVSLSVFEPSHRTDARNSAIATHGLFPAMICAALWVMTPLAVLAFTLFQDGRSVRANRITMLAG